MLTLWIGDFRVKQLKNIFATEKVSDDIYLVGDSVDYTWFEAQVSSKLSAMAAEGANVIIANGFFDCLFSCVWPKAFDVEAIADKYKTIVDTFVADYPSYNFYICATGPVDANYPYSKAEKGYVDKNTLNNKIEKFNKKLKKSKATYIDCYNYLTTTGFDTRDGFHYTTETCTALRYYIKSQINVAIYHKTYAISSGGSDDSEDSGSNDDSGDSGSVSTDTAVINRCNTTNYSAIINGNNRGNAPDSTEDTWKFYTTNNAYHGWGYGLPNCTAYALGRFKEYSNGVNCANLGYYQGNGVSYGGKAGNWVLAEKARGKYQTGTTPKVGAVICWKQGNKDGHVAVVEHVSSDGSYIIITESAWRDNRNYNPSNQGEAGWHFNVRKIPNENNKWTYGGSYTFQGFIYNPNISAGEDDSTDDDTDDSTDNSTSTGGETITYVNSSLVNYIDKEQVVRKHAYLAKSEMTVNAKYIWNYFGSRGWTLNAVAGMLGNMEKESTINPILMEVRTEETYGGKRIAVPAWPELDDLSETAIEDYVQAYYEKKGRYPGIGLTQWTSTDVKEWESHKLIKWCKDNNLDYLDIDTQLKRLTYECDNDLQFSSSDDYPMTFKEFSTSNLPAGELAKAFLKNYEKPASPNYEERASCAEAWFEALLSYAAVDGPLMTLNGFRAKSISATEAELSCIARKCSKYTYIVTDSKGKVIHTKTNELTNAEKGEIVTFTISNLIPTTSYSVTVTAYGDTDSDQLTCSLDFTTKQSYPSSVKNIKAVQINTDFSDPELKLSFENTIDWGYWSSVAYGYTVQLYVNGYLKQSKDMNISGNSLTIKPESTFYGYSAKVGDVLQIGIRTWTKNASNLKVMDQDENAVSNSVAMLCKPITVYLKV